MADEQEHPNSPVPPLIKKGCQISLMFPVKNDEEAMAIKKLIDKAVPDVEHKRYTFQITEM